MMEGDLPNKQQRLVQAWMEIHKNIFQPLKEKSFFESAKVQFGTVAWSDEIDISPETLYIDAKEVN
ncbi:MAG: DUF2442 domain-containing protein [Sulfurimonas sp.]|nr:DUF2442 domain-containing protein [Sulfurimonas sp.]